MFPFAYNNINKIESTESSIFDKQSDHNYIDGKKLLPFPQIELLQAVIESFVDGILIITSEGELLHTNECAREMCWQLSPENKENAIPKEIWQVCESLIESRELFPNEKIFMELEVDNKSIKLRIRARWLQIDDNENNYIIVTLEDCNQSSQNMAIRDAQKFGLTERETEVWLLRRANFSYREIAEQLYITINTVKKHLKNIYAKQQDMELGQWA
ncbi:LuxR family transcriptional regulator [Calothrix sp. NIES-4101]|nr:LuxR family transcriptional regulator [Calothrix sp. NIES-4101]